VFFKIYSSDPTKTGGPFISSSLKLKKSI